jgi:hypothetical protein
MALPKINETAYNAVTVPSTGKVLHFRPYLVSEEKVLLLAIEAGDEGSMLDAIKGTLEACCQETLVVDKLALFDFEYIFSQVRASSVGQTASIRLKCQNAIEGERCKGLTEVDVDISSITIDVDPAATVIQLTPDHTLNMRWPSYSDGVSITKKQAARPDGAATIAVQDMFDLISRCLVSVQSEDSIYTFDEESKEDIEEWLNNLKSTQLKMIIDFIQDVPKLSHPIEYKCVECGEDQTIVLEGLTDFF